MNVRNAQRPCEMSHQANIYIYTFTNIGKVDSGPQQHWHLIHQHTLTNTCMHERTHKFTSSCVISLSWCGFTDGHVGTVEPWRALNRGELCLWILRDHNSVQHGNDLTLRCSFKVSSSVFQSYTVVLVYERAIKTLTMYMVSLVNISLCYIH